MGFFIVVVIVVVGCIVLGITQTKRVAFKSKVLQFRHYITDYHSDSVPPVFVLSNIPKGQDSLAGLYDELGIIIEKEQLPLICFRGDFRPFKSSNLTDNEISEYLKGKLRIKNAIIIQDEQRKVFSYAIFEKRTGTDITIYTLVNLPGRRENKTEGIIPYLMAIKDAVMQSVDNLDNN